ncbi:MAG: glucose 1-dehydrogenase [Pseudomonadota bacterium]
MFGSELNEKDNSVGRLDGKKALITGGAQGMGACFAKMFADEGAKVAITDINGDGAEATAASITEKHPDTAVAFQHDVTDPGQWKHILVEIDKRFNGLSILVNNAGISGAGNIETQPFEEFRKLQSINVDSIFIGTQICLPYLRKSMPGSIINIASTAAWIAHGDMVSYCVSKAAVVMMTKSIALHCTKQKLDIRCNAICPAFTRTSMLDPLLTFLGDNKEAERKLVRNVPMKRVGEPEEVGCAAVFLASDEASYITGTEITVDGGLSAK